MEIRHKGYNLTTLLRQCFNHRRYLRCPGPTKCHEQTALEFRPAWSRLREVRKDRKERFEEDEAMKG